MNPILEHLIVLQAQDLELARLRAAIAEAPRRVAKAEAARAEAEKQVIHLRAALATEEKLRRDHEREIATHRTKLDRLRRSLEGAANEAQVTAFNKEIQFTGAAVTTLEDEELSSLERTDTLEAQLAEAAEASARTQADLEAERSRSTLAVDQDLATVAGMEEQRLALRAEVGDPWLPAYDRLLKSKGTAVAEALGNSTAGRCAACQMGVRPQRWQDLIGREHDDEIFACESCGRLLFWDPRRDTPRSWDAGDRLQAAAASPAGRRP